jgi:hypothetical protein
MWARKGLPFRRERDMCRTSDFLEHGKAKGELWPFQFKSSVVLKEPEKYLI